MLSETWGRATDPSTHTSGQFRYLVHGISPKASNFMKGMASDSQTAETEALQNSTSSGDQSINLYEEPERVAERISLSMSLIDQDHTGTWTYGGLILDVPEKNIIGNGPHDIGSANWDKSLLQSQFDGSTILNPEDLLNNSSKFDYNEVIAFANLDGSKIRLKGFFVVVDSSGFPLDKPLSDKIKAHADRLDLPLVNIKKAGFDYKGLPAEASSAASTGNTYDLDYL